ncbi:hypothetical protein E5C26_20950 [Serratia proteamaculans]|uniref:hypothetical protein n=1 Tax=Serratia proteamaculans TaxID=28151 RepID=UPI0010764DD9|nr:hypothetical protein [Serratia proteamaculans]TFZ48805.1 hypothetical protein E5C26_20950 [Serratia proteamaculans]
MNKTYFLLLSSLFFTTSSFADQTKWYQRPQEARDIRQDSRADARVEKKECYRDNDKSNRDCRRDKKDTKRDGRRDSRDALIGNYSR